MPEDVLYFLLPAVFVNLMMQIAYGIGLLPGYDGGRMAYAMSLLYVLAVALEAKRILRPPRR